MRRFVVCALIAGSMLAAVAPSGAFAQDGKMPGKMAPAAKPGGKISPTKKMPARDPKTGRFLKNDKTVRGSKMAADGKMAPAGKMSPAKKMPARDPKTGRFLKNDKK